MKRWWWALPAVALFTAAVWWRQSRSARMRAGIGLVREHGGRR
ncbi:hypothetical protein [Nocardia sienata]|nr:hypothetical protein [Nocardia sienata]